MLNSSHQLQHECHPVCVTSRHLHACPRGSGGFVRSGTHTWLRLWSQPSSRFRWFCVYGHWHPSHGHRASDLWQIPNDIVDDKRPSPADESVCARSCELSKTTPRTHGPHHEDILDFNVLEVLHLRHGKLTFFLFFKFMSGHLKLDFFISFFPFDSCSLPHWFILIYRFAWRL